MLQAKDFFYCYSKNLFLFLKSRGVEYIHTAYHISSNNQFWLYEKNDVKGEDGETLFYLKNGMIYAPRARELYPSNLINKADGWTVYDWATEYESQATLCGNALAKLRDELSTPAVTWTIEGYIDANIGDTISVHDNGYKPTLLLEARINSQRISMTNPSSNETTFSNVKEVQSEISAELIAKMNDIIKEKIQYTTSIITTNGTFFKNGKGSTVLKARVFIKQC